MSTVQIYGTIQHNQAAAASKPPLPLDCARSGRAVSSHQSTSLRCSRRQSTHDGTFAGLQSAEYAVTEFMEPVAAPTFGYEPDRRQQGQREDDGPIPQPCVVPHHRDIPDKAIVREARGAARRRPNHILQYICSTSRRAASRRPSGSGWPSCRLSINP
eukprot:3303855-Prymnesium_polylepis.1